MIIDKIISLNLNFAYIKIDFFIKAVCLSFFLIAFLKNLDVRHNTCTTVGPSVLCTIHSIQDYYDTIYNIRITTQNIDNQIKIKLLLIMQDILHLSLKYSWKKEANTEVLLYMYCEVYRCMYTIHYFSRGRHWLSGQRSNFKNIRRLISFRRATNIVVLHKMGVKYIVYSQHTHTLTQHHFPLDRTQYTWGYGPCSLDGGQGR